MEEKPKSNEKKRVLRVVLYIIGVGASLIYASMKKEEVNEHIFNAVQNDIFGIQGVSTNLSKYSVKNDLIHIEIASNGLPNKASHYKPTLLAFVCTDILLVQHLRSNKTIVLDMTAYDREHGQYVNMRIKQDRCAHGS